MQIICIYDYIKYINILLKRIKKKVMSKKHSSDSLQIVPVHKFIPTEKTSKSIGVCLWGPPGCGKSSGLAHIKNMLDNENIFDFNSNAFVEFLAHYLFPKTYFQYMKEKASIALSDYETRRVYIVKENAFKMELRETMFNDLKGLLTKYNESLETFPKSLYDLYNNCFIKRFGQYIHEEDWNIFNQYWFSQHNQYIEEQLNPNAGMYWFGPWWARFNDKIFVLETTGRTWDPAIHMWCFNGIRNILYMPFVSDLQELQMRVHKRTEQFGNPLPDFVQTVFQSAYGINLIHVLDSFLYDQIIIQGNNLVNYVMMSLEKIKLGNSSYGYILVKEFANDIKEANYIRLLLGTLFVPEHLHTERSILYDLKSNMWKRHI